MADWLLDSVLVDQHELCGKSETNLIVTQVYVAIMSYTRQDQDEIEHLTG